LIARKFDGSERRSLPRPHEYSGALRRLYVHFDVFIRRNSVIGF